jgi:uncharacterized protein YjbI with pentapeptide repeats
MHVHLIGAALIGVSFENANLKNSYLIGSHLVVANFDNVNMEDSYLIGADLSGCNFKNVNLCGSWYNRKTMGLSEEQTKDMRFFSLYY